MGNGLLESLRTENMFVTLCGVMITTAVSILSKVAAAPVHHGPQRPLYIHAVTHASHAQIQEIVLGQGGKVSAVDLVVQETLSVLTEIQVS